HAGPRPAPRTPQHGPRVRAGAPAQGEGSRRRESASRSGAGPGPGGSAPMGGGGAGASTGPRVAMRTAAVQLGTRSKNGTSSERKAGRKAQCQPTRTIIAIATSTSRASLTGEDQPSANRGRRPIWTKSAAIATTRAVFTRPGVVSSRILETLVAERGAAPSPVTPDPRARGSAG